MDKLNQNSQNKPAGMVREITYNKSLQQPVRPNQNRVKPNQSQGNVKPNQNRVKPNQGAVRPNQEAVRPNQGQGNVKPNQGAVRPNQDRQAVYQVKPNNQVKPNINQLKTDKQVQNVQQVNVQKSQQVQSYTQRDSNKGQKVINNTANESLEAKPKLTRLQRQSQGLSNRNIERSQQNNKELWEQKEYALINDNKESFIVKETKRSGIGFLILPLSFVIFLVIAIVMLISNVVSSVNELKINTTSLLNSNPIAESEFIKAAENIGLLIDNKELGGGITEVMAYNEDYSYEINYITFESNEETQAYYNYIIDIADESKSSVSSSIIGQNSAETTLISQTYNGFMDITYIDKTIIIAIAYDSNKQKDVIEFMNNLGY